MSVNLACGIDFGTSNSTCALARDGHVALVDLEEGKDTIPSAIFFAENQSVEFGRAAIATYIDGEDGRLMRSLKMVLGSSLINEKTRIGKRSLEFVDIISTFLQHIKSRCEIAAGHTVDHVIMGRPVYFYEEDAAADLQAQNALESIAKSVGFKSVQFQYEPIAAAFSHEKRLSKEMLSLVVDLGGGTSDFTVIRLRPDVTVNSDRSSDILSTSGVRVGGTHFDERLSMNSFMPPLGLGSQVRDTFDADKIMDMPMSVYGQLSSWPWVHLAQTQKAISETKQLITLSLSPERLQRLLMVQEHQLGHAYLQAVEGAKIALTDHDAHICKVESPRIDVETYRTEFERSISAELARISGAIDACLTNAQVKARDIDLIVMTGGSTEIPAVNQLIANRFPDAEISELDKFGSVGLGLGYHASSVYL